MWFSPRKNRFSFIIKLAVCSVALIFEITSLGPFPAGYAQQITLNLPLPGTMIQQSPSYLSPTLKGITIYPDDPFRLDFIFSQGDAKIRKKIYKQYLDTFRKGVFNYISKKGSLEIPLQTNTPGGIDFNPSHIDFKVQQGAKDDQESAVGLSPVYLEHFHNGNFEGLSPLIINVVPVNLRLLLGLTDGENENVPQLSRIP